ncbi:MAG TPA: Na(+)-translocating NADH-quinone reductase subunit A [Salinivirgaceae bacterium]|nr:Na(+)-translocating NADH-quinone reductase subunit A [Salinivirgaceae bacterium]
MPKVIKLRKGLDIPIDGEVEKRLVDMPQPETVAIKPPEFKGLNLKLLIKEGDTVKVGTPLLHDKKNQSIVIVSPVSGRVETINRGEQRRLKEIIIRSDGKKESIEFSGFIRSSLTREMIVEHLLLGGLWPFIIQRPFGLVADPAVVPHDIFISCFDTSPLAPDLNYIVAQDKESFFSGVEILKQLTDGEIYLGLDANNPGVFEEVPNVQKVYFDGPHPAGNVGVQIHHIKPIGKKDVVWTVHPQDVVTIGRFFLTGIFDFSKTVALTGSELKNRFYAKTIVGASFNQLVGDQIDPLQNVRFISGNPLTGSQELRNGYLGFYHHQITILPEGNYYEFMGWAMPRFDKFSDSRAYFSWLFPGKKYRFDTNIHGEKRPYVVTGEYERYLPMDILPVFLMKAIITKDIEQMENLGIYEVIEEDLALCEFGCTSKIEVQKILREGIDLMISELG